MSTQLSFLSGGNGIAINKTAVNFDVVDSQLPIYLKSTNLINTTTPSSDLEGNTILEFSDIENTKIGYIQPKFSSNGNQGIEFFSQRKINGVDKYNGISLELTPSGAPVINFVKDEHFVGSIGSKQKAAWHTALAPDVLFEWEPVAQAPSQTSITLKASAANYTHMKIYYCTLTSRTTPLYRSVCVYSPQGKYVNMFIGEVGSSGNDRVPYWKGWDVYINGTTISTRPTNRYFDTQGSTTTQRTTAKFNNIYITRVEAW